MDYLRYRNNGKFMSDAKIKKIKAMEVTQYQSLLFSLLLVVAATAAIVL